MLKKVNDSRLSPTSSSRQKSEVHWYTLSHASVASLSIECMDFFFIPSTILHVLHILWQSFHHLQANLFAAVDDAMRLLLVRCTFCLRRVF